MLVCECGPGEIFSPKGVEVTELRSEELFNLYSALYVVILGEIILGRKVRNKQMDEVMAGFK